MKLQTIDSLERIYSNYIKYCEELEIDMIRECPICHLKISPNLVGDARGRYYYSLLECPHCGELFIIKYEWSYSRSFTGSEYTLKSIFPKKAKDISIQEGIKVISPMFVKIYNQALEAEVNNLDQISGIGYRKALEFLIKDYLIHKNKDKEEEIKSKFLGKCIDMIDNENIKRMAKAATWIGNDETHYIRIWMDKDINDLKRLINLTIAWIDLELKTEEYSLEMQL